VNFGHLNQCLNNFSIWALKKPPFGVLWRLFGHFYAFFAHKMCIKCAKNYIFGFFLPQHDWSHCPHTFEQFLRPAKFFGAPSPHFLGVFWAIFGHFLALLASFLQDQYGKIMEKLWKH
jgi:hypothetical protein